MKFKDKTRGGFPVRIYATDGSGEWPIHGAYFYRNEWNIATWSPDDSDSGEESDTDLLPLREPSEAAVEAVIRAIGAGRLFSAQIREALHAAYEIDFPEGGK